LKVIGYIAAFEMTNGYSKAIYMSIEDIHEHARRYSRIYSNPKSIWKTNPSVMERKTVLRALLQTWGYLNPTDVAVMEQVEIDAGERPQPNAMYELPDDDEVEIVEEQHQPASVEENLRMLGYDISEPTEVVSGRLI
jgi:recombination protein RecT